ncbi:MAG TPA: hypothetical protein VN256_13160 [Pyrinomonadaceae bacterium]|nr:hypothetical protein [Pyrinomonadaceae bacterium]
MSAPALEILPTHNGSNFAPLDPLLKVGAGDKDASTSLTDALRERYLHFLNHEKSTREEMLKSGQEVALFLAGHQFLMPNPFKQGGWLPYKVNPNSANATERRALSLMQYHVSGNLEKWLSSNPDILITPGVESDEAYESAQAAKIIVNHYEKRFFNNKARLQIEECLEGLTFGSYIWRLGVDPTLKTVTAYRQIFENREVKVGPGWGKCGDCGNEDSFEGFNEVPGEGVYTCPKCHGEALVIPPAMGTLPSLVGQEPVELGDFRLSLVPFSNCRWDLRVHADESSWMIIRRRTTMSAIRQLIGNVKLPGGEGNDLGLDITDRLAYSGQAQAGYSSSSERPTLYKEAATVEEFWMSPSEYGDIQLQRSAKTVDGVEIPSGVRLGDLLKNQSICVLGVNEMSTVLGIYLEDHRDYIVQGKWYAKKGTGAGRGLQDLTEVQKVANSDHAIIHKYLRSTSTPAMLVAAGILDEGDTRSIATPGRNITVPLAALAEGLTLDQVVRPAFQPGSVPAQFFEFTYNRLGEYAQFASHFLPFTGGIPGVDNKTATGANITQAATDALYTPPLSVKGEIRQGIFERLIKLYPKHFPIDRQFPLGGKHSSHTGSFLVKADLCTDLVYEVVKDSWLPRNSYRKQQSYFGFFQLMGGIAGYLQARQMDAKRVADIERAFDLEMESDERNVAESLCFRRIRQMEQAANLIADPMMLVGVQPQVQVDPMSGQPVPTGQLVVTGQGAIQPPISAAEPGHEVKRLWLMNWLDSDNGLKASPVLRQAVEILVALHHQLSGQQGQMIAMQQGQMQLAQQQPGMEAQQEMQSQQMQEQLGVQQQQLELQAMGQQQELEGEAQKLELDAVREQMKQESEVTQNALKQSDREHALAVRQEQEEIRK